MKKNKKLIYAFLLSLSIASMGITACGAKANSKVETTSSQTSKAESETAITSTDDKRQSESTDTAISMVDGVALENSGIQDEDYNDKTDASALEIKLNGNSVETSAEGVNFENSTLNITKAGTYVLSGTLNGNIVVSVSDGEKVHLILNGAEITANNTSAIYMSSGDKLILTLADGTTNTLSEVGEYADTDDAPNATLFTTNNLTINGNGTLNVSAGEEDAIKAKANLIIVSGNINITAEDDAFSGTDLVVVVNGNIEIDAKGKGITSHGAVYIYDGNINMKNSDEGLEGNTVEVYGGEVTINASDDGINARLQLDDSVSDAEKERIGNQNQEGVYVLVTGGKVVVNAEGDGIDSNGNVYISGGEVVVYGPTGSGDGTLDYNGDAIVTGGTYIGFGMGGMVQTFGFDTAYVEQNYSGTQSVSSTVSLLDASGNEIASATALKDFAHVVIAGDGVNAEETYTLKIGSDSEEVTAKIGESNSGMHGGNPGGMPSGNLPSGNPGEMPNGNPPSGNPPEKPNGMPEGNPPSENSGEVDNGNSAKSRKNSGNFNRSSQREGNWQEDRSQSREGNWQGDRSRRREGNWQGDSSQQGKQKQFREKSDDNFENEFKGRDENFQRQEGNSDARSGATQKR